MEVKEIPVSSVEVSEFNVRKDLADGQHDSTIDDLAKSIAKQGLLSPITVFRKPNGHFGLVAGQRRLLACKHLSLSGISAIVRETLSEVDATTISLVENVHRADMNPRDKASAFKSLYDSFGNFEAVSRETGVGAQTIRKYIQLLNLAPELQQRLAAGEAKNTDALAHLAQRFNDPDNQTKVWDRIAGFTQDVQREIIKRADHDLENLDDLVDQATEGAFDMKLVRNCPFDCPSIPRGLKKQVAEMIEEYGFKSEIRRKLKKHDPDDGMVN